MKNTPLRFFITLIFLGTLLTGLTSQTCSPGDPGYLNIDFETDGNGNALPLGAVVDGNTYSNYGISMSASTNSGINPTGNYPLVIFDSSNPTGDDCDLGTPGFNCSSNNGADPSNDCAGSYPGKTNNGGGGNNCTPLGNIIIISENYPYNTIGQPDPNPDDLGAGGTINLNFDTPFTVSEIGMVDDAEGNFIGTYVDGSTISLPFNGGLDNDVSTFAVNFQDIVSLEIELIGSGGFSHFILCDQNTASIGDQLFVDIDNDGFFNPNIDTPIANVTVTLTNPDGSTQTTVTDDDGNYLFDNLAPGDYSVTIETTDPDFPSHVENTVDPEGDSNSTSSLTLGNGENNLDQDFGYIELGSIGDQLFVDVDNNGSFDPIIDAPIANVTVILTNPDGSTQSTVTDDNGNYLFEDLPAGDYSVNVETTDLDFPADVLNTIDPEGNNNSTSSLTLGSGEDNLDQDFGYILSAVLGDQLYIDEDGDGEFNPNIDTPIADVTITLTNSNGDIITTTTNVNGQYIFDDLFPDSYIVAVDINDPDFPNNSIPFTDADGINTPNTTTIVVSAGSNTDSIDFGYIELGTIGDQLFVDVDNNGSYDPNIDAPITNVTVTLTNPDGSTQSTVTDDNGNYLFEDLPAGDYSVNVETTDPDFPADILNTVDPEGDDNSTSSLTLGSGEDNLDQDFGYIELGSIGDQLFVDVDNNGSYDLNIDAPIANVTVTLTNPDGSTQSTVTDDNGNYLFEDLPAGDYSVNVETTDPDFPSDVLNTVDPEGDNNSTSSLTLESGEDNLDQDFGYIELGTIGDQLFIDVDNNGSFDPNIDAPIANVTITLTNPDGSTQATVTDDNGNYLFEDLPAGDYSVNVETADPDFPADVLNTIDPEGDNNSTSSLTLGSGEDNLDQDFGYIELGTIGDQLFVDVDGDGFFNPNVDTPIINVTVTLTLPDGSTQTTETGSDGKYIFENLPEGIYIVTVDTNDPDFPQDLVNTIDPEGDDNSMSRIILGSNEDDMIRDFGYQPAQSLPVSYLYIRGSKVSEGSLIEWATSIEVNASHFEVQKSVNGIDFITMDKVEAIGNSNVTNIYSFIDRGARGLMYYRLNQFDRDGNSDLSPIVTVKHQIDLDINVYPNPTVDYATVQLSELNVYTIYNLIELGTGRILISGNINEESTLINMMDYPNGNYVLELSNEIGTERAIKRIVKTK